MPLEVFVYPGMLVHVKLTPKISFGNQPPVADAGMNQSIYYPQNSVELNGSGSRDKDGEIISYAWTQVSGPNTAVLTNPNQVITQAQNLVLGDYKFRLTVQDDSLATGFSDVLVSVLPPEIVDFHLTYPVDKAMVTDTRKPVLVGKLCRMLPTTRFLLISHVVIMNGMLPKFIDRYTKVGESTTNSFTMTTDLVDRWTYKWYVIATTDSGLKYSDRQQFGLYLPYIEQENDGISIVDGKRDLNKNGTIEPYEDWHLAPEERLADLMSRMTLEEKISQLFYGGNNNPWMVLPFHTVLKAACAKISLKHPNPAWESLSHS